MPTSDDDRAHELIVRDRAIISDLVRLSVARDRDGGWSDDVLDIFTDPREVADLMATLARELMRTTCDLMELKEILAGQVMS